MGDGNEVVFSFGSLLLKIRFVGGFPHTDVLCGVEQSIAKITRITFLHMRVGRGQLPGLVSGRRHPGIGKDLVR